MKMHKNTTNRLGEGLRKAYQPPGDLPEAMEALLKQLRRPERSTRATPKDQNGA